MQNKKCGRCQIPLVEGKNKFRYLDRELISDVLKCPECGQVYLSEEFVKERIEKVERALEDK